MADKANAGCWVGFDLGGTKMLAAVLDGSFKVLGRAKKKTRGNEGVKAGVKRIRVTIEEALAAAGIEAGGIGGIGIGCPGPLDLQKGVLLHTPNLGWEDVPLRKKLEDAFGCPVFLMNDVDAGLYGEYRLGAAKGARCAVGVFPGTGIGGGCVYDGKLITGRTRTAFEFGHMEVVPDGPLCGCGRRGCLEAVASRLAISAAAAAAAYRGEAPVLLKEAGTDLSRIRSSVLAASIEGGDAAVEDIVRTAARRIGSAVGNVVNLLAPDVVVLGGGLVDAMAEVFVTEVRRAAAARAMPAFADLFKVVAAKLGDDAAVLGAATWAEEEVRSGAGRR